MCFISCTPKARKLSASLGLYRITLRVLNKHIPSHHSLHIVDLLSKLSSVHVFLAVTEMSIFRFSCVWRHHKSTVRRLETLERQLHDRKTSFSSFDADAKEFLAWLTKAEVALTHYEEMMVTDLSTSQEQQTKSQRTFNVCVSNRLHGCDMLFS